MAKVIASSVQQMHNLQFHGMGLSSHNLDLVMRYAYGTSLQLQ